MTSLFTSAGVFAIVFGGALTGIMLQLAMPEYHRDAESKSVIQLVMGLIATMAALVLSLLVASAHTFYITQQTEMQQLAANIILLDQTLASYGPETQPARQVLKQDVAETIAAISPVEGVGSAHVTADGKPMAKTGLYDQVEALSATTYAQHYSQSEALSLMTSIAASRLLIHEQSFNSTPVALLTVMITWLTILFLGFGIFARRNATVFASIFFGAVSVAAAIFLILEMSHPYSGLMRISAAPIENAQIQIGH